MQECSSHLRASETGPNLADPLSPHAHGWRLRHLQSQDLPRGGPSGTHQDTAQQQKDERGSDLRMEAGPTEALQHGRSE